MVNDKALRLRVKAVCCTHGVSVAALGAYWSFARQVEKGKRKLGGEDLRLYVAALIERYVELGLERKVLVALRYNVFTIGPPTAVTPNPKL